MYDNLKRFLSISVLCLISGLLQAQTTGKISGTVIDKESREPIYGASVFIEEDSRLGAATDFRGEYFIINIPPGRYSLIVHMMGYKKYKIENIIVSVNRTAYVDFELEQTAVMGKTVVIQAEQIVIKKDQTSSIRNISADNIKNLPVENLGEVIALQPGVVQGHFRGGRIDEVAYLVEGIDVTESFSGSGSSVDVEPEAVQDIEVITGTFNAEYGRAMSGIVNMVTKSGSNNFQGGFSAQFANYYTSYKDIFIGLKDFDLTHSQDYKFNLGGPIWKNFITFFTNVRYRDHKGHLNGCLLYTSPSPRDATLSRMPSSA